MHRAAGLLVDYFSVPWAITGIAVLTFASGVAVLVRVRETLQEKQKQDVSTAPQQAV